MAAGAPSCWLLWAGDHPLRVRLTFSLLVVGAWLAGSLLLRERVVRPLQTISNLLAALREGDYSIRARGANADDALGLALLEVNTLSDTLRSQRLSALEATALLRRVIEEIDVAVFAFDGGHRLRLVNRGGERLLGQPSERLLGRPAETLGLVDCLTGDSPRTLETGFPGGAGRWEVRSSTFRQDGLPHQLLVLSDLSRVLRAEERSAWQRLVRVLGHEINNSLAPIKSIAGSLRSLAARSTKPSDWEQDLATGLQVIEGRSEALGRFMSAYARLARLPQPRLGSVSVTDWIRRVAALETRLQVQVAQGPVVAVTADGDQLDQLLINLVRNAADAALETGGGVRVTWRTAGGVVEIEVEDEGHGLPDPGNLFVPFFTTKASGSGIGLVLSRQIAEAHGGALALEPRAGARGARARLRLPLGARDPETTRPLPEL
ncbi:MAG: PAS domain-containing sensor histidine kinase [Gemmatimonadales bacterium]|nr:PAS domain-containing sensor histidine kinase [Gemmatimonadales bacterium]